ncbi:MAG TPA: FAD-dependent oxidoreductase [Paludibacteraceae bacterium]|nr:FAD-dependent oxidoreductase [Paludibacteraceae bacterium]
MIQENFSIDRSIKLEKIDAEFVIVGGGVAGVCAAIAAARNGIKTALIQDRPILGGNGSSEVRLWILGATSHMGNNNRWAREGGIIDEILVENTFRNKEGNPVIFDTVLIDKVLEEKNILLFLNTVVYDIVKGDDKNVSAVKAYNSQNETEYLINGKLFCDASGDGILAYLAGATYRVGAEERDEFNERFVRDKAEYGEKLGHTLFFYTKKTTKPVKFVRPEFALSKEFVEKEIYRIKNPNYFNPMAIGCNYWWIEYGGRLDTIHDTEKIKYQLWSIAYGIWDYIKNSGKFPEAENITLEWVGLFPGKRESRRFVGPYMLHQQDIVEQHTHFDGITYGGWSIDLHPSDGVFSEKNACNQWHSKGVYQIPYRCYITKDIDNIFIAGRLISASHIAFGSSRVMATSAVGGEVVGTAAALCLKNHWLPADLADKDKIIFLQSALIEAGNYIPQLNFLSNNNLLGHAIINTSSELQLNEIPFQDGFWKKLSLSSAQMLPVEKGKFPRLSVKIKADKETELKLELRISSKNFNHTPDIVLASKNYAVHQGEQMIEIDFEAEIPITCYAFVCFMKNENLELMFSPYRITGILSVFSKVVPAVSNGGKQIVTEDIGIEEFEFWCPERRPDGHNIAMKISPAISAFGKENLLNSIYRPVEKPNAFVAGLYDQKVNITAKWPTPIAIHQITIFADTDADHPMESVQWGHYDDKMPFCIDHVSVFDEKDFMIASINDNHQTQIKFNFNEPIETKFLKFEISNSTENVPVSIFNICVK